ncbi:MAG: alpha/beta hydrolase [Chromatiales bacterium]|jgi:pimeloyl-ACP methyl ester carboxylesterase|nr:alpha/beta hydrolase [Chromatiales bacterium]
MTTSANSSISLLSDEWVAMSDGAQIRVRRSGNPEGPRVLLSHGNGFAADAFGALRRALEPFAEVVPMDLRNHGHNPTHDFAAHNCDRLATDLEEVLSALATRHGAKPVHILCHSVSGIGALRLAIGESNQLASMVLMEPPCQPPEGHPLYDSHLQAQEALGARTLRRKATFADPNEFVSRIAGRPEFRLCVNGALDDLARAILRQASDGHWGLGCPPEYESRIYVDNVDNGMFESLAQITTPTMIISGTYSEQRLAFTQEMCKQGDFELLAMSGVTHLLPMERPALIARVARAFIDQAEAGDR